MAEPSVRGVGTVASGTGSITPGLPAGTVENDVLLCVIETAAQAVPAMAGYADMPGTPVTNGTATSGTRLTLRWKRAGASESAPTVGDSGNHQIARIIGIAGCATTGDPWDDVQVAIETAANNSAEWPDLTTLGAERLIVHCIATGRDAATTSNMGAGSNANLTGITERMDNWVAAGGGGGIGCITGVKAAAGAIGTTTATMGSTDGKALATIAFKPPEPAGGGGGEPTDAVLAYDMEAGSGTSLANTGSHAGKALSFTGSPTWVAGPGADPPQTQAVDFDRATSDGAFFDDGGVGGGADPLGGSQEVTVSMLWRVESAPSEAYPFILGNNSSSAISFNYWGGELFGGWSVGGSWFEGVHNLSTAGIVGDGQYHRFTFTVERINGGADARVTLLIDGTQVDQQTFAGAPNFAHSGYVGMFQRPYSGVNDSVDGQVAAARVFARPLSSAEEAALFTAGGGAAVELAGELASATHAAASTLGRERPLAGQVASATALSGQLHVRRGLTGQLASASTCAGALGRRRALTGSVPAASALEGDLTRRRGLGGTAASASQLGGVLARARTLDGALASASGMAAQLGVHRPLSGQLSSASQLGATALQAIGSWGGELASASALSGALRVHRSLQGELASATTAEGALARRRALSGQQDDASHLVATQLLTSAVWTGELASASHLQALLVRHAVLTGQIASASHLDALLAAHLTLSGTLASASQLAGALTVTSLDHGRATGQGSVRVRQAHVQPPPAAGVRARTARVVTARQATAEP